MSSLRGLPILCELVPEGLPFSRNYLIEFEPQSLWYETSFTLANHTLRHGIKTQYHTFMRSPGEIRNTLRKLGLDVFMLEKEKTLMLFDSYTVTTGLSLPENPKAPVNRSVSLLDWGESIVKEFKEGAPQGDEHLHIDDNTSVLLQYNDEKVFIDWWRTRLVPAVRASKGIGINSVVAGVASEAFYKKIESLSDGIIDFRSRDESGHVEQYMRVRMMRGITCDSRWRRLQLLKSGEVVLDKNQKTGELGISSWIKGSKD